MKTKYVIAGVVVLAVIVVAVLIVQRNKSGVYQAPTPIANEKNVFPPASNQPSSAKVEIKNFAFSPTQLTIKVGQTVVWTNQDLAGHIIAADKGEFESATVSQGGNYEFTFSKAGSFAYHCKIHPSMKGVIIVK